MVIVNSINRAIKILKLLRENKEMTFTEINNSLKFPKSSTYDILDTLLKAGLIVQGDQYKKAYSLGLVSFEIGSAYLSTITVNKLAHPYMEELMNKYKTTTFLAVPNEGGDMIVYIKKVEPTTMNRATVSLGTRRGIYNTSLGKALLASYPMEVVEKKITKLELVPKTENTITDTHALLKDILTTKERGYAIDNREDNQNIFCLGAPILNGESKPVAAISLSFLYFDVRGKDIREIGKAVNATALKISKKLGYAEDNLFG